MNELEMSLGQPSHPALTSHFAGSNLLTPNTQITLCDTPTPERPPRLPLARRGGGKVLQFLVE